MPAATHRLAAAVAACLIVIAGCSTPPEPTSAPTGQYLALGDSYAAGFRPAVDGEPAENTTDGFVWQVADATGLDLTNVSCSGITTVDFVHGDPCPDDLRGDDAPDRADGSEASTALDHVDRNGDSIELVTIVLGANDFRGCPFEARWRACVAAALPRVQEGLDTLLTELRDRLGADVPIIGLTYPDVWLGTPVRAPDDPDAPRVARASAKMFEEFVNPALRRTYARHDAQFADVTHAFGGHLPVDRTTSKDQARTALICTETYYCSRGDGHPSVEGHERIAALVLDTLERR